MKSPKSIWLIRIAEDEMIWANEPYPGGDEADEDIAEYWLAVNAQAQFDTMSKLCASRIQEMQEHIDALQYALSGYDELHPLLSKGE